MHITLSATATLHSVSMVVHYGLNMLHNLDLTLWFRSLRSHFLTRKRIVGSLLWSECMTYVVPPFAL